MCPKEQWPILVQSVLLGKAQVAYSSLSEEASSDYEFIIKDTILKAYKLVPETYGKKFRDSRMSNRQPYVEFGRLKEQLFVDWFRSKEVKGFKSLGESISVEEFKRYVLKENKIYLEESQIDKLQRAAVVVDEYLIV